MSLDWEGIRWWINRGINSKNVSEKFIAKDGGKAVVLRVLQKDMLPRC